MSTQELPQRIFISYRRSDCQSQANAVYDGLRHRLPTASLFMDIDSIPPGADFEEHIRKEVEQCDLVLVMIGDNWLDLLPGTETRRIHDPNDFVRLEIESALASEGVRLLPVLVEGARMPSALDLPESIRPLARINAIELSDLRWQADVGRLSQQVAGMRRLPKPEPAPTMSYGDIDVSAVSRVVAQMPSTFATKDVSQHPEMLQAHPTSRQLSNYNTMIGRYLASYRSAFGLSEPGPAADDRGAIWSRTEMPQAPAPAISRPAQPPQWTMPPPVTQPARGANQSVVVWVMVALSLCSCGLLSAVPVFWAGSSRRDDPKLARRLYILGGVFVALVIAAAALVGTAPSDEEGVATGPGATVGAIIILLLSITGAIIAFMYRAPPRTPPGMEHEVERR